MTKVEIDTSTENNKLLVCKLCMRQMKSITNTHLKHKHNITVDDYRKLFPTANLIRESHGNKLREWRNSSVNKIHMLKLQKVQSISPYRKEQAKKSVTTKEYRENQSIRMKEVVRTNPEKFAAMWLSPKGKLHPHFKKSNWQRWFERYGKIEADCRLLDWKHKNKLPAASRFTSIELKVHEILKKHNIQFIPQYDKISTFYVDIFIPSINTVIEVDGDFWHGNPKKYNGGDVIPLPSGPTRASVIWERDKQRQLIIETLGYTVKRIFQSDINEQNVLELLGIKI